MQMPFPTHFDTSQINAIDALASCPACPPQMHHSSSLRHHTMLTTALDHVLNHMRMRDFAAHTPSAVSASTRIIVSAIRGKLVDELIGFFGVFRFWICVQEAGKVVDVAAGEADERFFLCDRGVSTSRNILLIKGETYLARGTRHHSPRSDLAARLSLLPFPFVVWKA